MLVRLFLFLCLITIGIHKSYAKDDSDLSIITEYIHNLKSVDMDFIQRDSRGEEAKGKILLVKPYQFRCNYYAPYPLRVLGNTSEVVLYDYALEQTTRIDRKDNLFNFLLADEKEWKKNFRLENLTKESGRLLFKLYHYPTERTISIILQQKPLILTHIIIDEPDGNIIEVEVDNILKISNVEKELFSLPNPDVFGIPKRLSKNEIEKTYDVMR